MSLVSRSSGTNKSATIRDSKAAKPAANLREIAEALSKLGLEVLPQFVSTILSNAKKQGGKVGERGRKPMAVPMAGQRLFLSADFLIEKSWPVEFLFLEHRQELRDVGDVFGHYFIKGRITLSPITDKHRSIFQSQPEVRATVAFPSTVLALMKTICLKPACG